MKCIKLIIASTLLIIFMSVSTQAEMSKTELVKDGKGRKIQVMAPRMLSPVVTISSAGDVNVSDYRVIRFSEDLEIYWGTDSSNTWPYTAGDYIGITPGVSTIHVDAACKMLVM